MQTMPPFFCWVIRTVIATPARFSIWVVEILLCCFAITLSKLPSASAQPDPKNTPALDRYGDPLPEGALSRLGTVRFRHPGYVGQIVFSPDGKTLASVGDSSVSLWAWPIGKKLPQFPAQHVGAVAFSADGRTLVTASDREKIRLWSIEK